MALARPLHQHGVVIRLAQLEVAEDGNATIFLADETSRGSWYRLSRCPQGLLAMGYRACLAEQETNHQSQGKRQSAGQLQNRHYIQQWTSHYLIDSDGLGRHPFLRAYGARIGVAVLVAPIA